MKYVYRNEYRPFVVEADSQINAVSKIYHKMKDEASEPLEVTYEDVLDNVVMYPEGDCAYDEVIDKKS